MASTKDTDTRPIMATPHASASYAEWVALQDRLRSHENVLVNGRDLSLADVVAVTL
jgi:phenylalanine ammonia-lyase